jgi:hypothetical protein
MYISMFYECTRSHLKKLTFYVVYVKMTKFDTNISLFVTLFFCTGPKKYSFFTKLCTST